MIMARPKNIWLRFIFMKLPVFYRLLSKSVEEFEFSSCFKMSCFWIIIVEKFAFLKLYSKLRSFIASNNCSFWPSSAFLLPGDAVSKLSIYNNYIKVSPSLSLWILCLASVLTICSFSMSFSGSNIQTCIYSNSFSGFCFLDRTSGFFDLNAFWFVIYNAKLTAYKLFAYIDCILLFLGESRILVNWKTSIPNWTKNNVMSMMSYMYTVPI